MNYPCCMLCGEPATGAYLKFVRLNYGKCKCGHPVMERGIAWCNCSHSIDKHVWADDAIISKCKSCDCPMFHDVGNGKDFSLDEE